MVVIAMSYLYTFILLLGAAILPIDARSWRRPPPLSNFNLAKYQVPRSNGSVNLPAPDGLTLKAITIGRGTQNYTCSPGSYAPPVAIGANATLFDATPILQFIPLPEGQEILTLLPNYLLSFDLGSLRDSPLITLGHHKFDAAGVPIFNIGKKGLFRGKKHQAIAAPKNALKGVNGKGDGAVDWLELCAVDGSKKIQKAYRVYTAGGKAPKSCAGQPTNIEVQYAAHYWFYG